MPDRRTDPWSTSGVVGWCTGVATIGGAFAGFIASQTKGSPWHQPLFDVPAVIAAIAFLLLVAAGVTVLITWARPAFRRPVRLITDRWQASTWPRIRAAFETFLQKPAIAELLADMTHAGQDASWTRQATSTSSIIDMVVGDGVASARLELPDGIRRHGQVEGYALVVVHVEPRGADGKPAPSASSSSWRRRFERALQLPGAFAALLSGELGLAISGEPPVQAGIRLEAPAT